MTSPRENAPTSLRLLYRAMLVTLALAAPILAVPYLQAADDTFIVAPTSKKTGAGFVLMVSLQRG